MLSSFLSLNGYSVCQRSRHELCPFRPCFVIDLTCGWFSLAGVHFHSAPHHARCYPDPSWLQRELLRIPPPDCYVLACTVGSLKQRSLTFRTGDILRPRAEHGLHSRRVNPQLLLVVQFENVWKKMSTYCTASQYSTPQRFRCRSPCPYCCSVDNFAPSLF